MHYNITHFLNDSGLQIIAVLEIHIHQNWLTVCTQNLNVYTFHIKPYSSPYCDWSTVTWWKSVGLEMERSPAQNALCCVLEQATSSAAKYLFLPRKTGKRPGMTEKLLTGM